MKQEIIENILNNFETPIYVFDIDKLKQRIQFLREAGMLLFFISIFYIYLRIKTSEI